MVAGLALAGGYLAIGKLHLLLSVPSGYPPAAWLPAGLALGVLLVRGCRLWPGVWLGSFLLNVQALAEGPSRLGLAAAAAIAGGIAAGAALQACAGVRLVRRWVGPTSALDEARDIGWLLLAAGPLASLVNATIGTSALFLGGLVASGDLALRWSLWWIADVTGALILTPLVLVWARAEGRARRLWLTVPVVIAAALSTVLFVRVVRWEQGRVESALRRRVEAIAAAFERRTDDHLDVLGSLDDMRRATGPIRPETFHAFAEGAVTRLPRLHQVGWISAQAPSGRLGFDALVPDGGLERLAGLDVEQQPAWRAALDEARRTRRPAAVTDRSLRAGTRAEPLLLVVKPVHAPGAAGDEPPEGFVAAAFSLREMARDALRVSDREEIGFSLVDTEVRPAVTVFRSDEPPGAGRHRPIRAARAVSIAGHAFELRFFARASFLNQLRGWQPFLVMITGLLFVAWLEAFLLIVTGRTAKIELLVAQRTGELEASRRAVEEQRAELARSNGELAAALQAKEMLLRELHHRVKNNLQVISSLISLQARALPDPRSRALLEESRSRVFSIALAHERLYRSKDLARIDFAEYARQLVAHLQSVFSAKEAVIVETDIHALTLPVETAVPCGLLINELVSNAFKHAFPDERGGAIRVVLRAAAEGRWLVAVEDDGVGLPAHVAPGKTGSLGLDLVSILATQIGADLEVRRNKGTSVRLTFRADKGVRADA